MFIFCVHMFTVKYIGIQLISVSLSSILQPYWTHYYFLNKFLVDFLGLSIYIIISSAYRKVFFFIYELYAFSFFFLPYCTSKKSQHCWIRIVRAHICFVPDHSKNAFCLSLLSVMLAVGFSKCSFLSSDMFMILYWMAFMVSL